MSERPMIFFTGPDTDEAGGDSTEVEIIRLDNDAIGIMVNVDDCWYSFDDHVKVTPEQFRENLNLVLCDAGRLGDLVKAAYGVVGAHAANDGLMDDRLGRDVVEDLKAALAAFNPGS